MGWKINKFQGQIFSLIVILSFNGQITANSINQNINNKNKPKKIRFKRIFLFKRLPV